MTFLSTRRTTAPRSSDHGARALINKAITTAVAECNSWRAGHIHDENSTMRAAACSSCLLHVPSVLPPSCHSRGFNVRARVHHGAIAARLSGHACSLMTVMASELGWTSSTHDQRPMVASYSICDGRGSQPTQGLRASPKLLCTGLVPQDPSDPCHINCHSITGSCKKISTVLSVSRRGASSQLGNASAALTQQSRDSSKINAKSPQCCEAALASPSAIAPAWPCYLG